MNLYFNGCSFTRGAELNDPESDAWPSLIAAHLGSRFFNDAVPGGTNQRSLYKTILNADSYDFFFIAWTHYARFTEYNPVDNFEINFSPNLTIDTTKHDSADLRENYFKYKEYGEMYYTHWFNELYQFKTWLQQILLLQAFFQHHRKKYIMLNTMHNNLSSWLQPSDRFIRSCQHLIGFFDRASDLQLLGEHTEIQKLQSLIDRSRFVGWPDWHISQLCEQHACGPGGHILEDGHRAVANKIINHLQCQ